MAWFDFMVIALVLAAGSVLTWLLTTGRITRDKAIIAISTVVQLIQQAESIWQDVRGAGVQKREYVLAQLTKAANEIDVEVAKKMIDGIVYWLNVMGW